MNKDLSHLPENKRNDLQRVVAIVREHCPAAGVIILFGSYARGDWKELKDLAPDRKSGHPSDYDILILTKDEKGCSAGVVNTINRVCHSAGLSATTRAIHHDIGYMNRRIETGRYFFTDIIAEGRVLYDDGTLELAVEKVLSPAEKLVIVQEDFNEWFGNSQQFFENHKFNLSKNWLKLAAFHLHQAAEAAYKTALIVFTGYIPDEHYLAILSEQLYDIDPAFTNVFHASNPFEDDAFTALEYAYIGARYDKRYTIDEPTVRYLAERVEELMKLTEKHCREKIAALQQLAESEGARIRKPG